MTAVALVFPGQGSQTEGMARAWAGHPAAARWTQADEILGRDVSRLGLDAPADELREPAKCQLALFVHHIVLLEAWRAAGGAEPLAVAGHSLGEYDALVAGGVLDFADCLRLVEARAERTQQAADAAPGSMVACLGFDIDTVAEACQQSGAYVANDNAPGQIVVAGSPEALSRLTEHFSGDRGHEGGRAARGKVLPLKVGAAYHSPHMDAAVEPFGQSLDAAAFADANVPVVANVDAQPHTTAGEWPGLLRRQLTAPVRWRETVTTLAGLGVDEVVELGASPVLTGLVKRTDRSLGRRTVSLPGDLGDATGSGAGA